jgi:ketol-acid reductoisomerase
MTTIFPEIAICGLGAQGKSWRANMLDQNIVPLSIGRSKESPHQNDLPYLSLENLENAEHKILQHCKMLILTVPDQHHTEVLQRLAPYLAPKTLILYPHGFSCLQDQHHKAFPELRPVLMAPKAIGLKVRELFIAKKHIPCAYSLEFIPEHEQIFIDQYLQNFALHLRFQLFPASFLQETQADLFSEQALLCSILPFFTKKVFDKMVEKNLPPDLCFYECWMEMSYIAEVLGKIGPKDFFKMISPNAFLGAVHAREVYAQHFDFETPLEKLWDNINGGDFAKQVKLTKSEDLSQLYKKEEQEWDASLLQYLWDKNRI